MDYELLARFYHAGAKFQYVSEVVGAFRTGGINTRERVATMREVSEIAVTHGLPRRRAQLDYWNKRLKHEIKMRVPGFVQSFGLRLLRDARGGSDFVPTHRLLDWVSEDFASASR